MIGRFGIAMFVVLKLVALGHGGISGVRARFAPALALLVSLVATLTLPAALVMQPSSAVGEAVLAAPWLPLLVSGVAGGGATFAAFKQLDQEPAGSLREDTMSRLAYTLLANTLLDAATLIIVVLATLALSRNV